MGIKKGSPTVRRIAQLMRADLVDFAPGDRFTSQSKACAKYGTNPVVAWHALRVLYDEGLLDVKPGSGFYVA